MSLRRGKREKRSNIGLNSEDIFRISLEREINCVSPKSRSKHNGKQKPLKNKRGRGHRWYSKVNANAGVSTSTSVETKTESKQDPKPLSESQRLINEAKEELEKVLEELETAEATYYGKIGGLSSKIKSTTDEYNALAKSLKESCDINGTFKNFKLLLRVLILCDASMEDDKVIRKYSKEGSTRKYIKNLAAKEQFLIYEVNVLRINALKSQTEVTKAQEHLAKLLSGKREISKELEELVKPVEFDPTFEHPIQSSIVKECDQLEFERQEQTFSEKIKATCMGAYTFLKEKLSSLFNY